MKPSNTLSRRLVSIIGLMLLPLITPFAQTNCVVPASGLVSWWRGEDNAADAVGINTGVLQNGTAFAGGEVGQAFHLDGVNDFISVPASASLNVGAGSGLTLEWWMRPENTLAQQVIAEWNNGSGGVGMHIWHSMSAWGGLGSVFVNVVDSSGGDHYFATAPGVLIASNLYHVAVTYDRASGVGKIFLNGTVAASATLGSFTPQTSYSLNLGTRISGQVAGNYYQGLLDDVSLYNRALAPNEIQAIYNAGSAGKCLSTAPTNCAPAPSGLVNWWAAEGGAVDTIGNLNGTLYGGTTFAPGKVGQAFSFDGAHDCVTNAMFGLTNILDSYTTEFWAWPTAGRASTPENTSGIYGHGNQRYAIFPYPGPTGGTLGSGISVGTNGVSVFEAGYAYMPALLVFDAPITGWTHIAVVYVNRRPSLYLNGMLVRSGLTSVNPSCPSTWLGERGAASANQGYYAGLLDEVSIYNRSLSVSEIQAIYNAGSAGKCTTPVAPYVVSQPTNQTVTVGDTVTFTVIAGGTAPLGYQWSLNGTNLAGATANSLTKTNVQPGDAGRYAVVISNNVSTVTSSNAVLTVNPLPPCVPPASGLVSWWRGEGDSADAVGGNDGVLQGGMSFGAGKVGQAILFNGTDSAVAIGNRSSLNVGAGGGLTIEAWIRPASATTMMPLVEWNSGSGSTPYGVHLWTSVGGAGNLLANIVDTAGNYHGVQTAAGLLTTSAFQHVALTYDKATGQGKLYRNGQVVAQENLGVFTPQTSYNCYLGFRPAGGVTRFAGALDEVSLYARALSDAEIQAIHDAGAAGKCAAPVGPYILTQPTSQAVTVGGNVTFTVAAGGTAPLSFQWSHDGTNLAGATTSSFTKTNVQLGDAGNYAVVVSNSVATVTSSSAMLTVNPAGLCVPPPLGLVSWWRAEGNAADTAGANNGGLQNGTAFAGGEVGQAFRLDGVNDFISAPASASLNVGAGPGLTLEWWMRPDNTSLQQVIAEWNNGSGGVGMHIWHSMSAWGGLGSVFVNVADSSGGDHYFATAAGVLVASNFYHVAVTYDKASGVGKIFLNGTVAASASLGSFTPQTSYSLNLGTRISGQVAGNYYQGLLDDVSLYNRALAPNEIQAIYNAGSAGKCTTPVPPQLFAQPTNQTVSAGSTVTLAVSAGGTPPLSYQWSHDGIPVADATNASLIFANVGTNDAGVYAVTITNQLGSIVSSNASLTVLTVPPSISVQPTNLTVVAGETATLAVLAGGTPPFGYQWNFNGSPLPDASGASLTWTNVGTNQAGIYSVIVTNLYGSVLSSNASLTVLVLATNLFDDFEPGIDLAQWSSFGGTVLATNYGGFVSPSHSLWFGGTGSRFATTRPVQIIEGGRIRFQLRFANGSSFPWETVDLPGEGVVLEYSVTGGTNWVEFGRYNTSTYFNWTPVSAMIPAGAEGRSTLFRWRQLSNSGVASDHWALDDVLISTTPIPPAVTTQPQNRTVVVGETATFTVTASGTWPLNYQWRFSGNDLAGQTGPSLTLSNVQVTNTGNYSVVVSNDAGSVTSSNAFLTVLLPPATVQVLNTNAMAGSPIEVPVILVANGNESAVSFSLNFNTQRLAFAGITLGSGASGAMLFPNTNHSGSGSLGFIVALDSGLTFAAGTQEIVRVAFTTSILGGTQPTNTPINITNQPINTLLADPSAQPLSANYVNGIVTLSPTDLEGDAAPRPGGDRLLDIFDWVQVGRYVAGLDPTTTSNEFQRVDCAPRLTLGDGMLKVTDWVQAGRYAAGLDFLTVIGGPGAPVVPGPLGGGSSPKDDGPSRTVSVANGEVVNGLTVTLPVRLLSLGNESGVGFSLHFDPAALRYAGLSKGSAAAAAILNTNVLQASAGKVGMVLALPAGSSFATGTQEIVRVTFIAQTAEAGKYPVVLGDQPVWRAVSDATAQELPTVYVNNEVVVHASPAIAIAQSGTNVILSWPSWAGDFTLQSADNVSGSPTNWSNTAFAGQTNGATVSVTAPASALTRFFRLFHP